MPYVDEPGRPASTAPRPPRARAGAPAAAAAPAGGPVNPYDTSSDPTLQRILALDQQRQADAQAEALRLRTQLAIDYGDEGLARSLGLGEADIAAARGNPFSTSAKEAANEKQKPIDLNEALNKQNLFYSGHGDLQRSELSRALLQDRYNANANVRGQLGTISSNLVSAERGAQGQDIQAQEDAAQRLRDRLGDLPVGGPGATGGPAAAGPVASALTRSALPPVAARPRAARRPAAARHLPRGY